MKPFIYLASKLPVVLLGVVAVARSMRRACQIPALLFVVLASTVMVSAQGRLTDNRVGDAVKAQALPFRLDQVRLLASPFWRAMELDASVLLALEPDRLLHNFRQNAGLPPKGAAYGGWESQGIAGHSLGHYLSALAIHYAATGDKRFLARANYIVDELERCQTAGGDGYVSGIPDGKRIFGELAQGQLVVKDAFHFNGGWVPWYTMHKLFAGLLDATREASPRSTLRSPRSSAKRIISSSSRWITNAGATRCLRSTPTGGITAA